ARGRLARPWSDAASTDRARTDAFAKTLFDKTLDIDKPVVDRVHDVARARGVPAAQIAMAWLLRKPVVTSPIVGATKPHHLEDAVAAVPVTVSDGGVGQLENPAQTHRPPGAFD